MEHTRSLFLMAFAVPAALWVFSCSCLFGCSKVLRVEETGQMRIRCRRKKSALTRQTTKSKRRRRREDAAAASARAKARMLRRAALPPPEVYQVESDDESCCEAEADNADDDVDIEEAGALAMRNRIRGRTVLDEDLNIVGDIIDAEAAEDDLDVGRADRANENHED